MIDNKIIITLVGLLTAVMAICKLNIGNPTEQYVPGNLKSTSVSTRSDKNIATQRMKNKEVRTGKSFCNNNIKYYSAPEYNGKSGGSTATMMTHKSAKKYANEVESFCEPQATTSPKSSYDSKNFSGPIVTGEYANTTFGPNSEPQQLPVGNMSDPLLELDPTSGEIITYTRQIYANGSGRNRDQGDPIRGDLPIIPRQGDWFVPSANPQLDLRRGGANVLFGASESGNKLNDLIITSSGGTDTTVGGTNVAGLYDITMDEPIVGPAIATFL